MEEAGSGGGVVICNRADVCMIEGCFHKVKHKRDKKCSVVCEYYEASICIQDSNTMTLLEALKFINEKNPWLRDIKNTDNIIFKHDKEKAWSEIGGSCPIIHTTSYHLTKGYMPEELEYFDNGEWKKLEVEVKNNA